MEEAYFLFDKKAIEDLDEFSIVDKLSTMQFSSPTKIESVAFANSLRVKLLCFDTTNQTAMRPQKLRHQALMLHRQ
jgi:hypothetical protein